MKRRTILEKMGDFVLGKGFYIVLFLCVATIGISGYYLIRSAGNDREDLEPVTGNPTVVLPDSQTGIQPAGSGTEDPDGLVQNTDRSEGETPQTSQDAGQAGAQTEEPAVQPQEPERPAATVYTWPVKGEVIRDFSVETLSLDPTLEDWRTHGGLDIASQLGLEVVAMCPGTVSAVYDDGLMGATVVIDHGDGLTAAYSNLAAQPPVEAGEQVETGTVIGTVGSTAIAESGLAPHLHLEVSLNGTAVDPREYLPQQ